MYYSVTFIQLCYQCDGWDFSSKMVVSVFYKIIYHRDERPPQSSATTSSSQLNSLLSSCQSVIYNSLSQSPERTSTLTNGSNGNNAKKWVPLSIHSRNTPAQVVYTSTLEHNDNIFRKVRGLAKKLSISSNYTISVLFQTNISNRLAFL